MNQKDKNYLHRMFLANCEENESYHQWLERELLSQAKQVKELKRTMPVYYLTAHWNWAAEELLENHFADPHQCNGFQEHPGIHDATGIFVRTPNHLPEDTPVIVYVEPQVNMSATMRYHHFHYKLQLTVLPKSYSLLEGCRAHPGTELADWELGTIVGACEGAMESLHDFFQSTRAQPTMF